MKVRTLLFIFAMIGIVSLAVIPNSWAIESGEFSALLAVEQYDELVSMCKKYASEIAKSPDAAQITSICAQASAAMGETAPVIPTAPVPTAPDPATDVASVPQPDDVFSGGPDPEPPAAVAPVITAPPASTAPASTRPVLGSIQTTLTADTFLVPFRAKDYDNVKALCEEHATEIQSHRDRDIILKTCGQAKIGSFQKTKMLTDLTGAMRDMEKSLKAKYDNQASFDLGAARLRTVDMVPKEQQKLDQEREAILEMWEAIMMRHAIENFNPAVSNVIIIWTIGQEDATNPGYVNLLIERVIKNEGNWARLRWLASRVRMITDRYTSIDPNLGEDETRKGNLEVVKGWMVDLRDKSYFDNNILVGMLYYKADRHEEKYDGTDSSIDQFHKALYYYDEAIRRAKSNKAMSVLHQKAAFLCSRYKDVNKKRLIEFYKKGFLHARKGLRLMRSVNKRRTEFGKEAYRYEEDSPEVAANLQKSYGNNLTGYIYNLYLEKKYKSVVGLKRYTLDVGFDWENKSDVLLLFAESAKELAGKSEKSEVNYRKYKEMALNAGSRAFKFVLKNFGGRAPTSFNADFCKVFNAYYTYLDTFGELVPAKGLENRYGKICPATGAPAAETAAATE